MGSDQGQQELLKSAKPDPTLKVRLPSSKLPILSSRRAIGKNVSQLPIQAAAERWSQIDRINERLLHIPHDRKSPSFPRCGVRFSYGAPLRALMSFRRITQRAGFTPPHFCNWRIPAVSGRGATAARQGQVSASPPHFHSEVQGPGRPDYARFRRDGSRSMAGPRRNPGAGGTRIAAARSSAPPGRGRRPGLALRSGSGGTDYRLDDEGFIAALRRPGHLHHILCDGIGPFIWLLIKNRVAKEEFISDPDMAKLPRAADAIPAG